jgi:hypothetical protein
MYDNSVRVPLTVFNHCGEKHIDSDQAIPVMT